MGEGYKANESRRRIRCIKLDNEDDWDARYEEMRDIDGNLRYRTFSMYAR
jgi:hypothetical protein